LCLPAPIKHSSPSQSTITIHTTRPLGISSLLLQKPSPFQTHVIQRRPRVILSSRHFAHTTLLQISIDTSLALAINTETEYIQTSILSLPRGPNVLPSHVSRLFLSNHMIITPWYTFSKYSKIVILQEVM
jgi:hypothetical protein